MRYTISSQTLPNIRILTQGWKNKTKTKNSHFGLNKHCKNSLKDNRLFCTFFRGSLDVFLCEEVPQRTTKTRRWFVSPGSYGLVLAGNGGTNLPLTVETFHCKEKWILWWMIKVTETKDFFFLFCHTFSTNIEKETPLLHACFWHLTLAKMKMLLFLKKIVFFHFDCNTCFGYNTTKLTNYE